jgi:hypothetical protein
MYSKESSKIKENASNYSKTNNNNNNNNKE